MEIREKASKKWRVVMRENIYVRVERLRQEIVQLNLVIERLETDYAVLTDKYMNGNIDWPIGKDQARIKREIEKCKRKIQKDMIELNKIREKHRI